MALIFAKLCFIAILLVWVLPAQIIGAQSCHYCKPGKRLYCNNPKPCPPEKKYCAYAWNGRGEQAMDCHETKPGGETQCGESGFFLLYFPNEKGELKEFEGTNGCLCVKKDCNRGDPDNENFPDEKGNTGKNKGKGNKTEDGGLTPSNVVTSFDIRPLFALILAVLQKLL